MSGEGARTRSAIPIAASLAEFTEKLIARRGVEQSNLLFEGQRGRATQALSARTNAIGVLTWHGQFFLFDFNLLSESNRTCRGSDKNVCVGTRTGSRLRTRINTWGHRRIFSIGSTVAN